MNILIITSSYPAYPEDPTGTAGLFIRDFALELTRLGHKVIIAPVQRKPTYQADPELTIEPIPWRGQDQELASMNFFNPANWWIFFKFFQEGTTFLFKTIQKYQINKVLCCWVIPCGLFGYWIKKKLNISYDTWALGSDIWKIRKIPMVGPFLIRKVVTHATHSFADGVELLKDVEHISGIKTQFLPSSRKLPAPEHHLPDLKPLGRIHLLFVGRYHPNKGPDLLLEAMSLLPEDIKSKVFLHMFGVGPMENALKEMITSLNLKDIVSLNGTIEAQEFSNYLKRVSFLIIPSRIESIPVVFTDALQIGTPVVSTLVGDLKSLIHEHHCGFVSESTDPRDIAKALSKAVSFKEIDFEKGIKDTYRRFDIKQTVETWLNK